jgi:LuxR family maltose regulon positive regulatory protein
LLLTELERREPDLVPELHRRAASWHEANGLPEAAIDHAQAAGDADRVARLVATLGQLTYAAGRAGTVLGWLRWFEDRGLVDRYPPVAVLGTWIHALVGRPAAAERWADAAEWETAGPGAAPDAQTPPDGSSMESHLAMARALLCRQGLDRMLADARTALAGLSPASRWRGTALLVEGVAELLQDPPGQALRADAVLADAVEVGIPDGALPAAATALAERSLLAIERHDWARAGALAAHALEIMEAGQLDDYIMSPLVHTVVARLDLHGGDLARARDRLARAARLRPLLTYAVPWGAVQTLLEMGRAYLLLDDTAGARAVLSQARDILRLRPDLGVLPARVEELWARLDTARQVGKGASSLSTAELRLLPLLATHLSFPEIGQRLYVSRNTVKTQAVSIYRKLGTSSRSEAVQRLREIGLLGG